MALLRDPESAYNVCRYSIAGRGVKGIWIATKVDHFFL